MSYYNHWKVMEGYKGSWDKFFDLFVEVIIKYFTNWNIVLYIATINNKIF